MHLALRLGGLKTRCIEFHSELHWNLPVVTVIGMKKLLFTSA